MAEARQVPDHEIYLWTFDKAQKEAKREYVKYYAHILNGALARHMHDFYEINLITGGSGKHFVGDKEIIASRGDVFVIPPHIRHGYSCKGNMTVYHILLSNGFMAAFAPFLEQLPGYAMLFHIEPMLRGRLEKAFYLRLDRSEFERVNRYIALIEEGEDVPEAQTEKALHILSLIAVLSAKMNAPRALNDGGVPIERVQTIIESMEYIEKNFAEKLRFGEVAARCAVSYSTFLRLFKNFSGVTPAEYQMHCRIENAAKLLTNEGETVLSTALSCGFYDSSHFIREFIKRKGVSPADFRKHAAHT